MSDTLKEIITKPDTRPVVVDECVELVEAIRANVETERSKWN